MIYTLTLNPALDREMTVAEFEFDKVLRASAIRTDYGGKGFNVSRALAALRAKSIALGFVGGATGASLARGLANLGIETDFVSIVGETRTNTSIVNHDHSHNIKVNAPGPSITSAEQLAMLDKIRALVRFGDWWILAGSLPPGVPLGFYADIIRLVQAVGAHAILDTDGEPLRFGCLAQPFLAKPNASEASILTGMPITSPGDARQAIGKIHDLGAERVVISLGKLGAVYSDGKIICHAEPPTIQERNPIGAGDAFVAGLVWGLSNNVGSIEAVKWGIASGAAAASLDGTAVGDQALVSSLKDFTH